MFLFAELGPLLIACLAAFCVGMGKSGVPSLSLFFNSLMLLALPTKEAIGLVLLLLIVGDIFAVFFYRKHADWNALLKLLPAIGIGLLVGTFLLDQISNEAIRPFIGMVVLLLFSLDQVLKRGRFEFDRKHPIISALFGSFVGVTTVVGNAAGPVAAMYFMMLKFDKYQFLGTVAWLFMIVNLSKVPLLWSIDVIKLGTAYTALMLIPMVFIGAFFGRRIAMMLSERVFSILVSISVVGSALYFLLDYLVTLF